MLKGFHVPLTPKGKSTLNPTPPWHYSCDFLSVEFWANSATVAAYLPQGLEPDPAAQGHANAYFCDWQFTGENEEYLEPARYQYREFFILLDAIYNELSVSYCPYMFVDNDAALARGWSQGYPKRLASVFQTRLHAANSKAAPQLASGSKFAATMSAGGNRMAQCLVTLQEPVNNALSFAQRPVINLLHVPQLAAGLHETPAIEKLVMNIPRDVKVEQLWVGKGELILPSCIDEELSDLAPLRCGMGTRASMSYTVDDLKLLQDLL